MWRAGGEVGWAAGLEAEQGALQRFYWVDILAQNPGGAQGIELSSRGHTHRECKPERTWDAGEDEAAHCSRMCWEHRQRTPEPNSIKDSRCSNAEHSPNSQRCLSIVWMCCTCVQPEITLFTQLAELYEHTEVHPEPWVSVLSRHSWGDVHSWVFDGECGDWHIRSKTEPGDQLKNKSAPCWTCKVTPVYCSQGFTVCPGGKRVI